MAAPAWPKPMPIVEVLWVDSQGIGGWKQPEAWDRDLGHDEATLLCRTAGYLYRRDRTRLVIMQSQSAGGCLADGMEIPRCAVRSLRVLQTAADNRRALAVKPQKGHQS